MKKATRLAKHFLLSLSCYLAHTDFAVLATVRILFAMDKMQNALCGTRLYQPENV